MISLWRTRLTFEDNVLRFYRKRSIIEVNRGDIEKIFYNTKELDKRVTILTKDGQEIDIPTLHGLHPLVKKLYRHIDLA